MLSCWCSSRCSVWWKQGEKPLEKRVCDWELNNTTQLCLISSSWTLQLTSLFIVVLLWISCELLLAAFKSPGCEAALSYGLAPVDLAHLLPPLTSLVQNYPLFHLCDIYTDVRRNRDVTGLCGTWEKEMYKLPMTWKLTHLHTTTDGGLWTLPREGLAN